MICVDREVDWDCVCAQPTCADSDDGAVPDDGGCEKIDDSSVANLRSALGIGVVAIPAPVHDQRLALRRSRWTVALPAPKKRSRDEEIIAAARMRESKQRRVLAVHKNISMKTLQHALGSLRLAGLLRDGGRTKCSTLRSKVAVIALPEKRSIVLPFTAIRHVGLSTINKQNDVARAFRLDKRTVRKCRALCAYVKEHADVGTLRAIWTGNGGSARACVCVSPQPRCHCGGGAVTNYLIERNFSSCEVNVACNGKITPANHVRVRCGVAL